MIPPLPIDYMRKPSSTRAIHRPLLEIASKQEVYMPSDRPSLIIRRRLPQMLQRYGEKRQWQRRQ
jgi:hypothetical protein